MKLSRGLHLVKRKDVWYVERCVRGIQTRRSLETGDLQEATRKALAGLEVPAARRPFPLTSEPKPKTLTLAEALEEYRDWYTRNRRESGARRLFPVLEMFVRAIGEDRDTRSVTRDDVQRWIDARAQGRSPSTVRGDFGRVRALIRWISTYQDAADLSAVRGIERPRDPEVTREGCMSP